MAGGPTRPALLGSYRSEPDRGPDAARASSPAVLSPPAAPSPPAVIAPSPSPRRTHVVVDGDTLTALAARYLGSSERYREIFQANRGLLPTPDLLPIGATLEIPAAAPATTGTSAASAGESPLLPVPSGRWKCISETGERRAHEPWRE